MKKDNLIYSIFFLLLMLFSNRSFGFKISIYTDQVDAKAAQAVIDEFKKTYPFNIFDMQFEIIKLAPNELKCHTKNNIDRLPVCDTNKINRNAVLRGTDQAMIVKDSREFGGSGGTVPVMTSASSPITLLHEYMHTLGFMDEYSYSREESQYFCGRYNKGANIALIEPDPNGYVNGTARKKHMGQIAWSEIILAETLITNGKAPSRLGTANNISGFARKNKSFSPSRGALIGLYPGKTCLNAKRPRRTWQPGGEGTIMENLSSGLGTGNEYMLKKILLKKGVPLKKFKAASKKAFIDKLNIRSSIEIKLDNEEMIDPKISNSSRGSFKPINEDTDRKSNSKDVFGK